MQLTTEQLEYCRSLSGEALLAAPLDESDELGSLKRLRKICPPEMAAAIWSLRKIRVRASESGKFPEEFTGRMLSDERMIQQSSSMRSALYAGAKLVEMATSGNSKPSVIYDLCCGMGSNAIAAALALRATGADKAATTKILGFDLSPQAVICAGHNAKIMGVDDICRFACEDVTELEIPDDAIVFIDPDRRGNNKRSVLPADHLPGEDFLLTLPLICRGGAIKLSPACSAAALTNWPMQWEYVGESGRCRQLLGWWGCGDGNNGDISAVILHGSIMKPQSLQLPGGKAGGAGGAGEASEAGGTRATAIMAEPTPGSSILLPHRAILAAGATDDLATALADAGIQGVYRLSQEAEILGCPGGNIEAFSTALAPAFARFTLIGQVPVRPAELRKQLTALGASQVEILTRGVSANTDKLQKELGGSGNRRLSVILYAQGQAQKALICQRADS